MKENEPCSTQDIRLAIKCDNIIMLTIILAFILKLGYCLSHCWGCPVIGEIVSALAILGVGWGVISILHRVMQKSLNLIIAFVLLFVYGIVVYSSNDHTYGDWWSNMLSPMNSTLSMFFPSRGGYEKGFQNHSLLYTSVHILSYLYVALLGISLFGRRVMNRSTYLFLSHKYKNIFWGYSDGGVLLAKDIKDKTPRDKAVFIMPENMPLSSEMEKYRFEEIDNIEGVVLYKDFSQDIIDVDGSRHFFLTEDQDLNVKLAFMVLRGIEKRHQFKSCKNRFFGRIICKCKRCRKSISKWIIEEIFNRECDFSTKLYVRTELAHVDRYFTKALENLKGVAEVNIINESELTARRFIEKCKPLEMPNISINEKTAEVNGEFNILQLGYGWSGKAILDKLICNTQFQGSTFSATVFDRDLKTKHGFYPLLDKECINTEDDKAVNYYNIKTECEIEVGSEAFKDWVNKHIHSFNLIIVALGDDTFNVHIALSIAKILNETKGLNNEESSRLVYAHIRNAECYSYFDLKTETPISVFGNKDRIYTMGVIVNEELEELAKMMNFLYCNLKPEEEFNDLIDRLTKEKVDVTAEKESRWSKASILDQDSSRAAATSIDNILRLMKWKRVKESDPTPAVAFDISKEMECLAENEHRRWNAFHFTRGIKYWNVSSGIELSDFNGDKPKPNRIGKTNSHAALVFYKDLKTMVDDIFNPLIKKYNTANKKDEPLIDMEDNDRKLIRGIAGILTTIGYKIVKI